MSHPDQLGADLLAVLARLHRWATGQADLPVPSAQARLLSLVDELGPARVSELAMADHSSQPTMTNQLNKFAEQGWIVREPDPDDARAVLVRLSEAGTVMLTASRRARHEAIAPQIAALSADDQRRLAGAVDVLRGLADALPIHDRRRENTR